jgi:hypothetical protein
MVRPIQLAQQDGVLPAGEADPSPVLGPRGGEALTVNARKHHFSDQVKCDCLIDMIEPEPEPPPRAADLFSHLSPY